MIDQIKEKYKSISDKEAFLRKIAFKRNRSYEHVRNRWFSKEWNIPVKWQKPILDSIELKLEFQKKVKELENNFEM